MKLIDKHAWIEIQDGKILSTRSKGRTKYYFPGGKREAGESDFEALSREINEELSISLIEDSTRFLGIFQAQADSHPDGVQVKMTCYTGAYTGTIAAASEIEEIVWLKYQDKHLTSPVDHIIFDWLKERELIR
ncbi:NUDIX hydrolase [Pontibacter lucknowensis]|uniref:8-oxo-dGTP diphosphatase n=1 Tax=Pontibacter lucknowensis TaxID=1077936 RepID=A0A1N6WJ14_9BACT|nr:NUDIX domain-containing protein [Pontibacter lucknowensis]SIQ89976.1 8-oxo-dGTP pyrophosphatase MutT, NUDIX family [Pontibacter lucknowensis]